MLHFIIIIIIDFYSAYLKKNIGAKAKKIKNKRIAINNWTKTLTPNMYMHKKPADLQQDRKICDNHG